MLCWINSRDRVDLAEYNAPETGEDKDGRACEKEKG
jgi:hypothetical protein